MRMLWTVGSRLPAGTRMLRVKRLRSRPWDADGGSGRNRPRAAEDDVRDGNPTLAPKRRVATRPYRNFQCAQPSNLPCA
jgi:hypothetical protein